MRQRVLTKYPDKVDRKEVCPGTYRGMEVFFALQRLSWSSDGPAFRAFGAALAVTCTVGSTEWWQLRGKRGSSNIACLLWQQKGVLGPVYGLTAVWIQKPYLCINHGI